MRKLIGILLLCFSELAMCQLVQPIDQGTVPINMKDVDRVWTFLKQRTNAPQDVPPPKIIIDWAMPGFARMATEYPTEKYPDRPVQISVGPGTVQNWPPQMVMWALGHEIVHYLWVLEENGWDYNKKTYTATRKHHCDQQFKIITRDLADELWKQWHDEGLRAAMYNEIHRSCATFPLQ